MKKTLVIALSALCALSATAGNLERAVDRSNLDPTTAPGENFYQYACGGWCAANPLDPQYARFGTFDQLAENSRNQVKDIITNLGTGHRKGSNEQKVGDLYAMGMDSVRLNQEGALPIKPRLDAIGALQRSQFTRAIADMQYSMIDPLLGTQIMADMKNSSEYMLYVDYGRLCMGDRDYYLANDANTVKVRKAYLAYVEKVMKLAGYKNAKSAAKHILQIETEIAQVALSREETRDYSKLYNIFTIAQLKKEFPDIRWDDYFSTMGINTASINNKVCVFQPKCIAKVNEMLKSRGESEIKEYLMFKYIDAAAPYLGDAFVDANFDMYSRAMSGKQTKMPRWKHALEVPNTLLGEAVGQLYVAKYFPEESKKKMETLVNNLKNALGEHIANLSWMSAKTKVNALVKLNSFTVKIGYPDKWRDYSALDIDAALSYWTNVERARQAQVDYEISQLGKPVDKDRWWMTPQTVNAYYEPSSNEICFPAAILQSPYFNPNADDASNYGAIGVVIGHEMTHGFDDQGRNFDHNGNMEDWWTEEDAAQFKQLAQKLADQYSAEIVADDVHANGEYTLGENIADHGGLSVSFSAFQKTDQGKGNEMIDGFTPAQRFYLSYANVWANNITKEEILRRTKVDPHSIGINRVNVAIRNMDTFFKAFDIKPSEKMWRNLSDRVTIW